MEDLITIGMLTGLIPLVIAWLLMLPIMLIIG